MACSVPLRADGTRPIDESVSTDGAVVGVDLLTRDRNRLSTGLQEMGSFIATDRALDIKIDPECSRVPLFVAKR